MAECIIARGGGRSDGGSVLPTPIPGLCQIVANVYDSEGKPFPDVLVCCKDGSTWYNYHSNENGQILFVANSGSVNITATNRSDENAFTWIDQSPPSVINIDAPVSTSKYTNINYTSYKSDRTYTSVPVYSNIRFRNTNSVYVVCGGAGGGGGGNYAEDVRCYGGAGGAKNAGTAQVNVDETYQMYIGAGGSRTSSTWLGTSGGSTSFLGVSAVGGGGAQADNFGFAYQGNAGGGGGYYPDNRVRELNGVNGYGGSGGAYEPGIPNGGRGARMSGPNSWTASSGGIGGGGGASLWYRVESSGKFDRDSPYYTPGRGGGGMIVLSNFT